MSGRTILVPRYSAQSASLPDNGLRRTFTTVVHVPISQSNAKAPFGAADLAGAGSAAAGAAGSARRALRRRVGAIMVHPLPDGPSARIVTRRGDAVQSRNA